MTSMSYSGILEDINISKIRHSSCRIRDSFVGLEDLAESIKQYGLLQPIVVRPMLREYEVVAGNRRLAASSKLRLRKISCHIMELSDKEAYEVGLIENIQHHTMNAIEEALAYSKYVDDFGWGGISELARQLGKSQEYVTKRIQLLNLPDKIKTEIISRRITPSVASELLPLNNKRSIENIGQFIINNSVSKSEARNIVKRAKQKSNNLFDTDPTNVNVSHETTSKEISNYDRGIHLVDKALMRSIALLKSTLVDFDEIINSVNENWMLTELLMEYRLIIHGDIDTFLRLRKKLRTKISKDLVEMVTWNGKNLNTLKGDKIDSIHHSAKFLS